MAAHWNTHPWPYYLPDLAGIELVTSKSFWSKTRDHKLREFVHMQWSSMIRTNGRAPPHGVAGSFERVLKRIVGWCGGDAWGCLLNRASKLDLLVFVEDSKTNGIFACWLKLLRDSLGDSFVHVNQITMLGDLAVEEGQREWDELYSALELLIPVYDPSTDSGRTEFTRPYKKMLADTARTFLETESRRMQWLKIRDECMADTHLEMLRWKSLYKQDILRQQRMLILDHYELDLDCDTADAIAYGGVDISVEESSDEEGDSWLKNPAFQAWFEWDAADHPLGPLPIEEWGVLGPPTNGWIPPPKTWLPAQTNMAPLLLDSTVADPDRDRESSQRRSAKKCKGVLPQSTPPTGRVMDAEDTPARNTRLMAALRLASSSKKKGPPHISELASGSGDGCCTPATRTSSLASIMTGSGAGSLKPLDGAPGSIDRPIVFDSPNRRSWRRFARRRTQRGGADGSTRVPTREIPISADGGVRTIQFGSPSRPAANGRVHALHGRPFSPASIDKEGWTHNMLFPPLTLRHAATPQVKVERMY